MGRFPDPAVETDETTYDRLVRIWREEVFEEVHEPGYYSKALEDEQYKTAEMRAHLERLKKMEVKT